MTVLFTLIFDVTKWCYVTQDDFAVLELVALVELSHYFLFSLIGSQLEICLREELVSRASVRQTTRR
jgi:hypothetical protein